MKKATRQQYASAAKARRQKQILAGLGVVLVAVLVIQGPKMLKMVNGSSSTPSTTTTSTTTTSTPGTTAQPGPSPAPMTATPAPALAGAGLAAGPSGVADASPPRTKSQIYSFELFDSKNPFVQQVTTPTTPQATAVPTPSGSVPSAGAASPTPAPSAAAPNGKTSGGATPTTASYAGSQPRAVSAVSTTTGTALISVDGKSEMVAPGQAFPTANPTFKLVSIANGTALIGLVGGTYASGTATVTLVQGRALTLLDTTDGVRYQLQLDALSAR